MNKLLNTHFQYQIPKLLLAFFIFSCFHSSYFNAVSYAEQSISAPPPLPPLSNSPQVPPPLPVPQPSLPPLPQPQTSEIPEGNKDTHDLNQNTFKPGNENIADNKSKVETKSPSPTSIEQAPRSNKETIKTEASTIEERIISLGTSPIDGLYYPLGSALCLNFNRDNNGGFASNPYCRAVSTAGSIDNINGLKEATLDLALVKSNWQKQALNGTGKFSKAGRYDNLRFVLSLHNESLAIIVKRDSAIKTLNDLPNKTINIGKPGSSIRVVMDDIMKTKNWTYTSFKAVTELEHKDEVEALCSGKIDAMILIVEHPNAYIKKVTSLCETNIINVNDSDIINFIHSNNEYKVTTIPGKLYLGISNDVQTIGIKATLVTSVDTSEETIYKITKSTFYHLDSLKKLHPSLQDLNMHAMLNDGRIAPLHTGVLKYLQEIGYDMNNPASANTGIKQ